MLNMLIHIICESRVNQGRQSHFDMTSHIYHTKGDFVIWFEIHVLPLSFLKYIKIIKLK